MADGNGENNCLVTLHYATLTYSFTNDRAIDQMLNVLFLCFLYLNMSFQYYETLLGDARSRYDKKLSLVGLNECPYRLPQGSWKNDPTKWPAMEYGDMYAYLIDTPGVFTRESMKNKKSLEAHNYFESGWVETVLSYDVPDSRHLILKANVKPSQRVNNQPHKPWVALTTEGVVSSAHCDCMAGLGESCSHVGALLYKIEAAVRLGYTRQACTEIPCKWNNDFVKKVIPEPIHKIKFYNDKRVAKAKNRTRRRMQPYSKSTPQDQERLLQLLKNCDSKPVVLSCFNGYSEGFHWKRSSVSCKQLPVPLRKLFSDNNTNLSETELQLKCENIAATISISVEESAYVSKSTAKQSDCLQWFEQRCGRITSSNVHAVLHTDQRCPARSVLKQICFPETVSSTAMRWGKDNEKRALKAYSQIVGSVQPAHKDLTISETGLKISVEKPFLAASADSVTECKCHMRRVVEIKCPYTHRQSSLKEFLSDKNCYVKSGTLLKSHKYYSQVQLQMYAYETAMCDFFVWTEKFCLLVYVTRDDAFIAEMVLKTETFFKSQVLPELLTRRLENTPQPVTAPQSAKKLYCVCQKPEDAEQYVGCDNPTCPYQWLHLKCLKLKKAPRGAWYCPKCRRSKPQEV